EDIGLAAISGVMASIRVPPKKDDDGLPKEKGPARAAKQVIGAEIEHAVRAHHLKDESEKIIRAAKFKSTRKKRLALERELLRKWLEEAEAQDPNKLNALGKAYREALIQALRSVPNWDKPQRILVGNWGFDACLKALPDVIVEHKTGRAGK